MNSESLQLLEIKLSRLVVYIEPEYTCTCPGQECQDCVGVYKGCSLSVRYRRDDLIRNGTMWFSEASTPDMAWEIVKESIIQLNDLLETLWSAK